MELKLHAAWYPAGPACFIGAPEAEARGATKDKSASKDPGEEGVSVELISQ